MSLSGKFFSRTTPSIIARELQAGKINHMYLSQNSLILCFIILIFIWLIIVERRFLPAPLARTCIFAPRFIFIVLTTWLTPYRFYASASSSFVSEEINLARMTSNRFQSAWIVCALNAAIVIAHTGISRVTTPERLTAPHRIWIMIYPSVISLDNCTATALALSVYSNCKHHGGSVLSRYSRRDFSPDFLYHYRFVCWIAHLNFGN